MSCADCGALQFVARRGEFGVGLFDGRGGPREIVLHFGDFERREQLAFAHPVADIHVDVVDVARRPWPSHRLPGTARIPRSARRSLERSARAALTTATVRRSLAPRPMVCSAAAAPRRKSSRLPAGYAQHRSHYQTSHRRTPIAKSSAARGGSGIRIWPWRRRSRRRFGSIAPGSARRCCPSALS